MVIVQCVENGFAFPPEAHKLGVLEHPQLVADGRLAQLHGVRNILHAKFAVVQGVQNFDAGGIAKHAEQVCQSYSTSSSGISTGCFSFSGAVCSSPVMLSSPFVSTYEHLFMCS